MRKAIWFLLSVMIVTTFAGCQRRDYSYYAQEALKRLNQIYFETAKYKSQDASLQPLKQMVDEQYDYLVEVRDNMDAQLPQDEGAKKRMLSKYDLTFKSICGKLKEKENTFRSYKKNAGAHVSLEKVRKLFDPAVKR